MTPHLEKTEGLHLVGRHLYRTLVERLREGGVVGAVTEVPSCAEALAAYIEAGHHLSTRFGRVKTYRQMAAELCIGRSQIHLLVTTKYPEVAAKMREQSGKKRGKAP